MTDNITLDVTGFYYSVKVDLERFDRRDRDEVTVKDVTEAAVGRTGTTGGRLKEVDFSDRGFLNRITVEHSRPPKSRQTFGGRDQRHPQNLPIGVYSYSDEFLPSLEVGDITFTPVWQYYVFDRTGDLETGSNRARDLTRSITPSAESDRDVTLRQGYLIRWRLVCIGGLRRQASEFIASLPATDRAEVEEEIKSRSMGLRDVIAMLGDRY